MADAEQNKQVVKGAYEGLAGGDVKAFLGVLHPEIEIHEPDALPFGGTYRGTEEILGFMGKAAQVLAPGQLEVEHLVAEGDHVVAVIRLGLQSGGDARVTEHWLMRDGKAVEVRVFWFDPTVATASA